MRLLTTQLISSIAVAEVYIEESELKAYEGALDYILKNFSDMEIEEITWAERNILERMHEDLVDLIKQCVLPEFWPDKFRD